MKRFLKLAVLALALTGTVIAGAASLTTTTGKVFHNVELKKIAVGHIVIEHDGGKATLELAELPDDFIAALSIRQRYALQSMIDLPLGDGRLLKRSSIVELGEGCVTFACDGGVVKVPVTELPAYYLRTFTRNQLTALKQNALTPSTDLMNPAAKTLPQEKTPAVQADNTPAADAVPAETKAPSGTKDKLIGQDAKGRDIYEGPRGGQYYLNPDGKKVYLPKKK